MELALTAALLSLLPGALQGSTPALPANGSLTTAWARSLDSGRTDPGVGETAAAGQRARVWGQIKRTV